MLTHKRRKRREMGVSSQQVKMKKDNFISMLLK